MSTSPSWFDQDKFSRLVKKVGAKTVTGALPSVSGSPPKATPAPEPESTPEPRQESLVSTAHISLVSKPSSQSESRALPALPRRTTSLPTLKALFSLPPTSYAHPATIEPEEPEAVEAAPAAETPLPSEDVQEETGVAPEDEAQHEAGEGIPPTEEDEDLSATWLHLNQLNEELARAILERDQAMSEGVVLREQLRKAEEAAENKGTSAPSHDVALLTEERNQARKEYAELRAQFESLKQDQSPKEEAGKRKELEQQLKELREKLEQRDKEIADLKTAAGSGGAEGGDDKLKNEITSLREQLVRAKEDASNAQRGLVLSQKALQETRDTLREATEGTSLSRHNFDNIKSECATLSQQNAVLQAQVEQLTRDLASAKARSTGRL